MGQGLCGGAAVGTFAALTTLPVSKSALTTGLIACSTTALGVGVDLISDIVAKEGKVVINRDVVLNAEDLLRHVYTFYCPCESNPISRFIHQKHEWVVLESHGRHYYTIQKSPANGNVMLDMRNSLRSANDLGLGVAGRPVHTGEIRQHRADMEFDLPNDVPVAYVIAWVRKEDPRWAFSTENSRHFTTRVRYALNDF